MHPVVVYYKHDKDTLQHYSLCFLSDDLDHNTTFVYEVQRQLIEILKERQPHIKNIEYFSDGCVAHYKNYKNFMNVCFHREDFGLTATWAFFATSHGNPHVMGYVVQLNVELAVQACNDQLMT